MSTIRLRLGDEVFDIPTVGASNWGEQITLYLKKNSEILANIQGPQDILLTQRVLEGTNGNIVGLSFSTADIQHIIVDGYIERALTDGSRKVDSFICEGIYDGSDFHVDINYTGTDAGVKIAPQSSGQFTYESQNILNTSEVKIFFRAKTIIQEEE